MNLYLTDSHSDVGIHFIVNGTLPRIEGPDGFHVCRCQFEVKDVKVFLHPFFSYRLGDDGNVPL